MNKYLAGFVGLFLGSALFVQPGVSQADAPVYAVGLRSPHASRGEEMLQKQARLQLRGSVALPAALDRLAEAAGVKVAYSRSLMPSIDVTCDCQDVKVAEALKRMLVGTGLDYGVLGDRIVIRPRPTANPMPLPQISDSNAGPLLQTGPPSTMTEARNRSQAVGTITGRVRDAQTAEPLGAVQVFIPELEIGGLSQPNGTYVLLNVPAGPHSVSAQLLGYGTVTREVTVLDGQSTMLDFSLREEALQMDEIIVTGTPGGTQRRAIGNVVSGIHAAEVANVAPVLNVEQLIGARVAGVVSIGGGGVVGAGGSIIRVRSATSPSLAGNPLVYVDGVRINADLDGGRDSGTSRLNDINPNDIESIEIIKGPAAATLYGTEAANGVIQIITKKGQTGAPRFDVFTEVGANWMANPEKVIPVNWGLHRDTNELINMYLPATEEARGTPFLQNGPVWRAGVAATGGTDRVRYYASYTRGREEGVVDWNWQTSNAARTNIGINAAEWLNLDLSLNYSEQITRFGSFWADLTRGSPRNAAIGGSDSPQRGWDEPPDQMKSTGKSMADVQRYGLSLTASAQPFSWLRGRMTLGLDWTDRLTYNTTYRREADSEWGFEEGSRSVDDRTSRFQTADLSLTATYDVNQNIGTATSGGLQYNKRRNWNYSADGDEFASPVLTTVGAAARTEGGEDYNENVSAGFYVQEQLDWQDRIFLTGAIRMDDNSAFGTDFDAAIYPKLSGTWVLHEESFFNVPHLSTFRFRGAWGAAGRQPNLFDAARVYEAVTGASDLPSLTPDGYGNPDLGPERSEELELGFDAGLFEDRVQVEFTQYWRKTTDAIVSQALTPGLGFPGDQMLNIGQVSGWGSELQIGAQLVDSDNWGWGLDLGLATMHSEIDDLGGIDRIPVGRSRQHIEGYPLASVFNIKVVSADFKNGTNGAVTNIMCDGGTGPDGRSPGGTPVPCDDAPLLYQGPGEPTWNANLTSTLTFHQDIQLYTSIDGRGGNIQHVDNIAARHTSWRNSYARNVGTDPIFMGYTSTERMRLATFDASFLRLREVGLRYSLPSRFAQRVNASALSVTLSARNLPYLWRAQKYTSIGHELISSPEVVITSGTFLGEAHSSQPPSTTFTFSIRASF